MNAFVPHRPFTEPGRHADAVRALPRDIGSLLVVIRGLLVHCDYMSLYGLKEADVSSRETLPVERRLDWLLEADARPLSVARPPDRRAIGTCRDYALLTCGMLRSHAVPARVRCGFARYFTPGRFDDHWICEYWRVDDGRWARADAQLDEKHREHLRIEFDASDLPAGEFVTADEAWREHREGNVPPDAFGHGADAGEWFLRVNLARDYLALRDQVTSPWDTWRDASGKGHRLSPADRATCDAVASCIAAADNRAGVGDLPFALSPFWMS